MRKVEAVHAIDFGKYRTFHLGYYKRSSGWDSHLVRPSTSSYGECVDVNAMITLEGAVLAFDPSMTIPEILFECAVRGVDVDFITIYDVNPEADSWSSSSHKIVKFIDCHKEDPLLESDRAMAPQYYMVTDRKRKGPLKFVVVDRYRQDDKIDFAAGKYDPKAAVAAFSEYGCALDFCARENTHPTKPGVLGKLK